MSVGIHTLAPPARDLAVLEDEITELAAHLNAATYRLLTFIAEFDQRSGRMNFSKVCAITRETHHGAEHDVSAGTCLHSPQPTGMKGMTSARGR